MGDFWVTQLAILHIDPRVAKVPVQSVGTGSCQLNGFTSSAVKVHAKWETQLFAYAKSVMQWFHASFTLAWSCSEQLFRSHSLTLMGGCSIGRIFLSA